MRLNCLKKLHCHCPSKTNSFEFAAPSGAESLQPPTPPHSPAPSGRHIPVLPHGHLCGRHFGINLGQIARIAGKPAKNSPHEAINPPTDAIFQPAEAIFQLSDPIFWLADAIFQLSEAINGLSDAVWRLADAIN